MTSDQYAAWILAEGFDQPARQRGSKLPPRKHISMTDKVAAMLCLMPPRRDGTPLVPPALRAQGAKAICAYRWNWDHIIARVLHGTDTFDNYMPLDPTSHKPKTKTDKKRAAHNARLEAERERKEAAFRARLLAPTPTAEVIAFPKRGKKIAKAGKHSRPMPGGRNSKWKQKLRTGKWERRA